MFILDFLEDINLEVYFRYVIEVIFIYWLYWKDINCVLIYKISCCGDFLKGEWIRLLLFFILGFDFNY